MVRSTADEQTRSGCEYARCEAWDAVFYGAKHRGRADAKRLRVRALRSGAEESPGMPKNIYIVRRNVVDSHSYFNQTV